MASNENTPREKFIISIASLASLLIVVGIDAGFRTFEANPVIYGVIGAIAGVYGYSYLKDTNGGGK